MVGVSPCEDPGCSFISRFNLRCGWTDLGKCLQLSLYPFCPLKEGRGEWHNNLNVVLGLCPAKRIRSAPSVVFSHVVWNVSQSGKTWSWCRYTHTCMCILWYICVCVCMCMLWHITESQNVSSQKGPTSITGFSSLPLSGLSKTKPYD